MSFLWQGDEREAAIAALLPLLSRCAALEAGGSELAGYLAILREHLGGEDCAEPPFTLSERESQTLRLVAAGQSNKEIARTLDISVETVKWHLKNLYGKLQVTSRTRAMSRARELSLLE